MIKVKIVNKSNNPLPVYAHVGDAGMDLRANIEKPITINTLERAIIPTGIHIQLPEGYEAQIRPRSGLAANHGISVCNTPGTIDGKFRDQIQVILINLSNEPFTINPGDRIAQIVFKKFETVELVEVEELDMNGDRGGGLGHTGIK
jgi:dUTP pyrophosphatase